MKNFHSSSCKERRGCPRFSDTSPSAPAARSLPSSPTFKSLCPKTRCEIRQHTASPQLPQHGLPWLQTQPQSSQRGQGLGAGGVQPPGWKPLILFISQTPAAARKEVGRAGKLAGRYRSCHRRMTAPRTSDPHQVTRCPCPAAEGPGPPCASSRKDLGLL